MLYVKVKTCSKRPNFAQKTINELNLSDENIWYDLREIDKQFSNKSYAWNAAKGWASFTDINCGHCMFIDDDLEFCNNFLEISEKMIKVHPDAVFGLLPFYYENRITKQTESPYWNAGVTPGACLIIPKKYLKDVCSFMFSYCDKVCQDDLLIYLWCHRNRIQTITTIPSLVQHIGDESVCDSTKPIRRTKYFDKNPIANWDSKIINFL